MELLVLALALLPLGTQDSSEQPMRITERKILAATDPHEPLRQPLRDAVMLLGWRNEDLPRIEAAQGTPAGGTTTMSVEGWVRYDDRGIAFPVIYVRTDTEVYRAAGGGDYQAVVRLAGILAHERWHLRNGRDEMGAYNAELTTMEYLHANTMNLAVVRQALRRLRDQVKERAARQRPH